LREMSAIGKTRRLGTSREVRQARCMGTDFLADKGNLRVVDRVLGHHIKDPIIFIRRALEALPSLRDIIKKVLGLLKSCSDAFRHVEMC
jgi:hypothetical protein